jgi:hypothetical protein
MKWYDGSKRPEVDSEILVKFKPEGVDTCNNNNPETLYVAGIYRNNPRPNGDDDISITMFDNEDIKIYNFKKQVKRWAYLE